MQPLIALAIVQLLPYVRVAFFKIDRQTATDKVHILVCLLSSRRHQHGRRLGACDPKACVAAAFTLKID